MNEILKDDLREIRDDIVYCKPTAFAFNIFGETGKGGRTENQDSFWFGDTSYGLLLVVCDGMGGGPGGRTASTLAVQEIGNYVNKHPNLKPNDVVIGAVLSANKTIYTYAKQHLELMGMGSTCVVALLTEEKAIVCHIGDSRFYQLRDHKELFHTSDHSQVYEMVKNGIMSEEDARVSPISNVITKALGLTLDLRIDIQPNLSSDILELPYRKGDRLVLTTDGIHGILPNSVLVKELTASRDTDTIVQDVHSKINQLGINSGNQHDNLTILIAVAKENSAMPENQRPPKYVFPKSKNFNWRKNIKVLTSIVALLLLLGIIWYWTERANENGYIQEEIASEKNLEDSSATANHEKVKLNEKPAPQKHDEKTIGDDTDYESVLNKGREASTNFNITHSNKDRTKGKDRKKKEKNTNNVKEGPKNVEKNNKIENQVQPNNEQRPIKRNDKKKKNDSNFISPS